MLPDGKTSFNLIQNATDTGEGSLVFFLFDLLFLDSEDLRKVPVLYRKERLATLLSDAPTSLQYNNHHLGRGAAVHKLACKRGLEGIVSKRADGIYEPGQRSWLKTKCLNREEFVVVGYSDPEGSRHRLGSLLLGYYTPDGRLLYAGRAGTGMPERELERLWQRLQPLAVAEMPLAVPPPRGGRFGSPLVLSRGTLDTARTSCRGQLCRVDAGWSAPACRLFGRAGGQAGHRGTPCSPLNEAP